LGTAILDAMRYAIAHDYPLLVNMDADFSHHPRYLPLLVEKIEVSSERPIDVMIGSRYVAGGSVVGWPARRRLMSVLINVYARWALRLPCRDCSGSFRCYRTACLRELDFTTVRSRGYSFLEEILWLLHRNGARLAEIPIEFSDRRRGQSKINVREAAAALAIISRLGARTWVADGVGSLVRPTTSHDRQPR
jgi:dolichol-phosphate mannosyltransferase